MDPSLLERLKQDVKRALPGFLEPCWRLIGRRRQLARPLDLHEARRILVIRPDGIGDVILTVPFLRELRRSFPRQYLAIAAHPLAVNLLETCPYVDDVIPLSMTANHRWPSAVRRGLELGSRKFDVVINPRWHADYYHSSFVAYFSGAEHRIGFRELPELRPDQIPADFLLNHLFLDSTVRHEVLQTLSLLQWLGGSVNSTALELWTTHADEAWADGILGDPATQLAALGLGASAPRRRWPPERFLKLGHALLDMGFQRIVLVGGPSDGPQAALVAAGLGDRALDITGTTTLRRSFALLKHCRLFVGNDSGPAHLAAAAGCKVVVLSAHAVGASALHPQSPERFHPWGVEHTVVRPRGVEPLCMDGCEHAEAHCILRIDVEDAVAAVDELLAAADGR